MDLKQAYTILEISETVTMPEIKQAYRDLAQVWHPDHHSHNERLKMKAQEKMKELNAAFDYICLHFNAEKTSNFTDNELKKQNPAETIVVCIQCGTKNRLHSPIHGSTAKCGRCGSYLFLKQNERWSEGDRRTPCGDGVCTGLINSFGRCTQCGKTYEEGVAADKDRAEKTRQQQSQNNSRSQGNKTGIYISVIGGLMLLIPILLEFFHSPPSNRTGLRNLRVEESTRRDRAATLPVTQSKRMQIPIESEPVNPNRLKTGSAPYTGEIRAGQSEITVDNGTDTDAIVRVVRFRDGGQQKVMKMIFGNDYGEE